MNRALFISSNSAREPRDRRPPVDPKAVVAFRDSILAAWLE